MYQPSMTALVCVEIFFLVSVISVLSNASPTLRSQLSYRLSEYHNYPQSFDLPMRSHATGEVRMALCLGCLDGYAQVASRHYLSIASNAEK